jgi:outer membrane lipoprotein-sorting protein
MILLAVLTASARMSQSGAEIASDQTESKTLSAKEIVERVLKTYASCKSYRDSGTAKIASTNSQFVSEYDFDTVFVRPNNLRFELSLRKRETIHLETIHVVFLRKGDEFLYSGPVVQGVEKPNSLEMVMASVAGFSGLRAHTVLGLVLPKEIETGSFKEIIADPMRLDDERADKIECFRISGTFVKQPRTIWIDKKTFLIRKIVTTYEVKKRPREDTATYDPEIDVKIPEEMLKFERKEQ